jgi:predicted secreted hydrolase
MMAHVAVSDIDNRQHHHFERLARAGAGLAAISSDSLDLFLGPVSIKGEGDPFPVRLQAESDVFSLDLELGSQEKPIVLQGDKGYSRKGYGDGNASYYYSMTRLPTSGTLRIGKNNHAVEGYSWMDREWSTSVLEKGQQGWDWFSLQLDDGSDLMFYRLRNMDGSTHALSAGSLLHEDGTKTGLTVEMARLEPFRWWESEQGERYPVAWSLKIPHLNIDLEIDAAFDDQLMETGIRYWEGAVKVSGSQSGKGYMELSGY